MAEGAEVIGPAQRRQIFPGTISLDLSDDILKLHHNRNYHSRAVPKDGSSISPETSTLSGDPSFVVGFMNL
jgi:hypothetical protein